MNEILIAQAQTHRQCSYITRACSNYVAYAPSDKPAVRGVQYLDIQLTIPAPPIYRSLENFRALKFLCDKFLRVKFSFSGPSTKMYHGIHRENLSCTKTRWMSTERAASATP